MNVVGDELVVPPSDDTGGGVTPSIGLEVPVLTTGDSVVPPSASVAAATVGLVVSINCSNAGLATGLNVGHGIVGSNVPPPITGDVVGFDVNSNPAMVGAGVVGTGGVVGEAVVPSGRGEAVAGTSTIISSGDDVGGV